MVRLPASPEERAREDKARKIGQAALAAGKAAALLVAGGQGTRLGFDSPKGMFPIGPVSQKSLFQVHAEKILALSRRFGRHIPLYIMTSGATEAETKSFFESQRYFGLQAEDVFLFRQGEMPAVDFKGKILLEAKDRIALSPDGHGGCIPAMKRTGALDDMRRRGVETILFFHVDNPLVNVLDPVFLGHHIAEAAEMSGKVVPKRDPEEKVGVVGLVGKKLHVIEYIDLRREDRHARNPDGSLKYSAGVIGIYLMNVAFVERLAGAKSGALLPFHRSEKAVPCLGPDGQRIAPKEKNGIKFETFVFDALPHAKNVVVMEVRREDEFAPVKNKEGEDSPATARALICGFFGRWVRRSGLPLKTDKQGHPSVPVEVSPLFALDEEEFQARIKGTNINCAQPIYLR
jgi:UDP-N-acetylglucosamine/UDP-N-acetylgalactosamine diphosphorylase